MDEELAEFERIVAAILTRYCAQRSQRLPATMIPRITRQLSRLILTRGLPRPLAADEPGAPGSLSEDECASLSAQVLDGVTDASLAEAARQLVKACFYPEFKVCRDSFRETTRDGACRRQELERARARISGSHCVDCPHWVGLTPAEHVEFLAREWHEGAAAFRADQPVFLPEDFRSLRRWLHAAARRAGKLT
jgi:hypothetical protein